MSLSPVTDRDVPDDRMIGWYIITSPQATCLMLTKSFQGILGLFLANLACRDSWTNSQCRDTWLSQYRDGMWVSLFSLVWMAYLFHTVMAIVVVGSPKCYGWRLSSWRTTDLSTSLFTSIARTESPNRYRSSRYNAVIITYSPIAIW